MWWLVEALRGTTMGVPNPKHAGTPAVVQKHYGHLRTAALSLAGDCPAAAAWNELFAGAASVSLAFAC